MEQKIPLLEIAQGGSNPQPVDDVISHDPTKHPVKPFFRKLDIESALSTPFTGTTSSLTGSVISGPVGIPLSGQLEKLGEKNVSFFLKRRFYIPRIMNQYKSITPEKASQILTNGSEKKMK
jgi:hypothetical protein